MKLRSLNPKENFMLRRLLTAAFISLASLSAAAAPIVLNGRIHNIDGDRDGQVDDLKISRIQFQAAAGTTVFFDSMVWESTNVDLNGDGFLTGFDNYMWLRQGTTSLFVQDDSSQTFGDGSVHRYDSAYGYTFANAGLFTITLGQLSYLLTDSVQGYQANRAFSDYQNQDDTFGAWRLTMTVSSGSLSNVVALDDPQNRVPAPGVLLLSGLGLLAAASARRRR